MIQFTCCTKNVGNMIKQRENLKKKLKSVNIWYFSTTPVKICAK